MELGGLSLAALWKHSTLFHPAFNHLKVRLSSKASSLHCLNASLDNGLWSVKIWLSCCQANDVLPSFPQTAGQVTEHHRFGWLQICNSGIESLGHRRAAGSHSCIASWMKRTLADIKKLLCMSCIWTPSRPCFENGSLLVLPVSAPFQGNLCCELLWL